MSLIGNIAGMFRNTQQVAAPVTPAPGAPTNQPVVAPLAQVNPGADPNVALSQQQQQGPANPMEALAKLWETDPKAVVPTDPLAAPLFNTDPAKILQSASKVDFLKNIPQDLMAKVMAGNDPAALMQLINTVSQQSLAAAVQLNAATVENATSRNNQRMLEALPAQFKSLMLSQSQAENPSLNHPAAQPFIKMVRQQIAAKDPTLTPAQINAQAEKVLTDFAGVISAPTQEQQQATAAKVAGTDWDIWAGNTAPS
jgi:hypothetical protein